MRTKHQRPGYRRKKKSRKPLYFKLLPLIFVVLVIFLATYGGTLAYILTGTPSLENTFVPAQMGCEVLEDFSDGFIKKDVHVKNTSDTSVYIRVKLLPYWYDKENNEIVAKAAWTPVFTPEAGWERGADGFYYYTSPVAPGGYTTDLIPSLELKRDDVSLSRQVLEIIASCIQAEPADAVKEAWSVDKDNGSVTDVTDGKLIISAQGG